MMRTTARWQSNLDEADDEKAAVIAAAGMNSREIAMDLNRFRLRHPSEVRKLGV